MKKISLSVPQLIFVVATRAALAAGVALLFSQKLNDKQRRAAGASLMGLGTLTTFPAARFVLKKRRPLAQRLRFLAT
jgi:hypothetical protein